MSKDKGVSLRHYLVTNGVDIKSLICKDTDFYADTAGYENFLDSTKIVPEVAYISPEKILTNEVSDNTHSYLFLVNSIIEYLLQEGVPNVLTYGYIHYSSNFGFNSTVSNPNVSFGINHLKSSIWETICNKIGPSKFAHLVLNTNCFIELDNGNYLQVFGTLGVYKNSRDSESPMILETSDYLYHRERNFKRLIPQDSDELQHAILKTSRISSKKYRGLKYLCRDIIRNHSKCPYRKLFQDLKDKLQPQEVPKHFLERASPKGLIIKFILITIAKVFPLRTWGSSKNKSVLYRKVIDVLNLGKDDGLTLQNSISGIKISEMKWIYNNGNSKSLQGSVKNAHLFECFIDWFFSNYLKGLIRSCWYVTESSGGGSNLFYFPHDVWNEMTTEWLKDYAKNNLKLAVSCMHHGGCSSANMGKQYFHGNLRLVPKQNDFRLLCIPVKSNIRQYNYYMYNYVYPVRTLLMNKMREKSASSKHPCCYSTTDVIMNLQKFIGSVSSSSHDKLFAIKFDMKHCYDMLNKRQIINIVENLLDFEEKNDNAAGAKYFVREYRKSSSIASKYRSSHYEVKENSEVGEFDFFAGGPLNNFENSHGKVLVDKTDTKVLSESDVLGLISDHVYNSAIITDPDGVCYERQRGIFQGFPLSATLCDIVYNDLVSSNFNFLQPESSIVLRLADDFLVVSTDATEYQGVKRIIEEGFDSSHGAIINKEKTVTVEANINTTEQCTSIDFIGFEFNPKTLEINRHKISEIEVKSIHLKSFKSFFSFLTLYLKRNLSPRSLDSGTDSVISLLTNIELLIQKVLHSFCINFKYVLKNEGSTKQLECVSFLLYLLAFTLGKYDDTICCKNEIIVLYKYAFKEARKKFPHLEDIFRSAISLI